MLLHGFPKPFRYRAFASIFLALTLVAITGCGGSDGRTVSVEGKALSDGQPLSKGSVRFKPDAAKGNDSKFDSVGEIGPDGTYKLTTQGKPGAPLGWYKVAVISSELPDSGKPFAAKSYVNSRFNDPETSKIAIEVVAAPVPDAYLLNVSLK